MKYFLSAVYQPIRDNNQRVLNTSPAQLAAEIKEAVALGATGDTSMIDALIALYSDNEIALTMIGRAQRAAGQAAYEKHLAESSAELGMDW